MIVNCSLEIVAIVSRIVMRKHTQARAANCLFGSHRTNDSAVTLCIHTATRYTAEKEIRGERCIQASL